MTAENIIKNTDIGWFFEENDSSNNALHFYSKQAVAALIQDADLMAILERNGFPKVLSSEEAIKKFKQIWLYEIPVSQTSFHIISGIFFGFPKKEVLAYSEAREGEKQASGYDLDIFPSTGRERFFGWLVVSTTKSEVELERLKEEARFAVDIYHSAIETGMDSIELFNNWTSMTCGRILRKP